ncbi:MAG: rod-binding protein [Nitrospinota bacterium]
MKNYFPLHGTLPPLPAVELSKAAKANAEKDDAALKELSQEFEALLVSQMMKAMRAGIPSDGIIEKGFGEDVYTEMLDDEYAKSFPENSSNSLWERLYEQVSRKK